MRDPWAGASWRSLLAGAARELGSRPDARRIVERASGLNGASLVSRLDDAVPGAAAAAVATMVARRLAGEPLQYVVAGWGFRGLDLYLDPRVLVPRPETEQVVDVAMGELASADRRGAEALLIADLGTGSGAIALSVAEEVDRAEVWAVDSSAGAIEVASANLAGMSGSVSQRVHLLHGSWYEPLPPELQGALTLVVSNPPYVAAAEWEDLDPQVREHEPREALVPGESGLEAVAAVVGGAPQWLAPTGAVVVEIAPGQAGDAATLARERGFRRVEIRPDLAGRSRVLVAAQFRTAP